MAISKKVKIDATPKAYGQMTHLSQALGLRGEQVVEKAMSLLWQQHTIEIRAHLKSIDDGSALFGDPPTMQGRISPQEQGTQTDMIGSANSLSENL